MNRQQQLFILVIQVLLAGCESSDNPTGYGNGSNVNIDSGSGSATGGNDTIAGSSGFVPVGGSSESPSNVSNPIAPLTKDAAAGPTPIDSGIADGAATSITPPPITRMDSGSTSASDGGQGVVDSGTATDSGTSTTNPVNPDDLYDAVRQVCVDTINEYRATLGLAPVKRASVALEQCSDQGAKQDGDTGMAHSSAGNCAGLGAQNTCPGYRVGGWGGAATLADSLKGCLAQMWAEGEPPQGRDQCIAEYYARNTACFMTYGHYINMSNPSYRTVACGFYDMGNNTFWMNQNFGP